MYLRQFLLSEYAHSRSSKKSSEKLEKSLTKKNPQTVAFGDDLTFIRLAWKFLGETSHLGKDPLGNKLDGEGAQAVGEVCYAWAAIREIWKNHPELKQQAGINYGFMVPLVQSKSESQDSNLNGILDAFVQCRNAKHHPKDYSIGQVKVNLELTDSYFEFINPILEKEAKFFFENLASVAERIKKYKVERVEVVGEEHHAHFLSVDSQDVDKIEKKVSPNQVVKGEAWYLDKENLLFKAHDLIPDPLPEEAPAPLPESVAQEGVDNAEERKGDDKNKNLVKGKKPPGIDRIPFNVPFQSIESRFIGRDETLNKLRTELENGQAVHTGPCVLIEGMGGMGKSQLAVEYAHKFRKEYPGGVLWFVANEKAEPQLARFAVDQLGYPEEDKDENLAAMTRLWMNANEGYLLILDNLDEENESEGFLPKEHKKYHLIGTARERFSAEWNPLSLDELSIEDAQLLLVEYMAGYGRDFLGTPEVAELSQALQRHPLALELAGRYMCKVEIAPSKYLEIFKSKGLGTKGLTGDEKTRGTGHLANLAATLAIDFDQLSERPEIFRFLSIFSRWNGQSMSLGLLGKMAGIDDRDDAMLSVKEAATYSLLHLSDDDRVRMHPFMAQALRVQVLERDSAVSLVDMARAALSWLSHYRFEEYAQRVALELDSLDKLLEDCRQEKLVSLWPQLARELSRQLNFQARHEESHQLAKLAIQAVKDQDLSPPERVRYLLVWSDSLSEKALFSEQLEASRKARDFLAPVKNEVPELWVETLETLNGSLSNLALYGESKELTKELTEFAQSKLPRGSRWRGSALSQLGSSLISQAKYENALNVHKDAYQFLKDHLGNLNPWTVTARSHIGGVITSLGKYKEALSIRKEILRDVESMYGEEHPKTADSLYSLSNDLGRNGKYLEASKAIDRGLAIIRETYGELHPTYARFLFAKVKYLGHLGRYSEALELARESLSIFLRHYQERHTNIGCNHGGIGNLLIELCNFKAAKDHLLASYEIDKSIYGDEHISTGTSGNNLANCLNYLGQSREALKLYERSVELCHKTYGKHHPETAAASVNLASGMSSLGRHEQGIAMIREAVKIEEEILGANHPSLATSISTLATCLYNNGKSSEALELERQALDIKKSSLGDKHPLTVTSMREISLLLCLTNGDLMEAHSLATQAYEISCETMGEESAEAAFGLERIGTCLYYQKKHEEELKVLRQAYNLARKIFDKKHPELKRFKIARDNAFKRVNSLTGTRPGHGNPMQGRRHRKKK